MERKEPVTQKDVDSIHEMLEKPGSFQDFLNKLPNPTPESNSSNQSPDLDAEGLIEVANKVIVNHIIENNEYAKFLRCRDGTGFYSHLLEEEQNEISTTGSQVESTTPQEKETLTPPTLYDLYKEAVAQNYANALGFRKLWFGF